MKGSDVVVRCLENQGVDVVFAYPGGQAIDLHNSFARAKKIRVILPRHEQGGGFMAQGYARATGKVGVCMATSGPGAMNLLTAIADAFMDSIPMVAITGQVFSHLIGKSAFQETDVYGMTLPVVKHSFLVLNAEDLPQIIKEAFIIAKSGRPGPVLIDIPKFSKLYNIPVATTLMGIGAVDPLERKNLYWFGMHGTFAGNKAVLESDLLIALGARFDDRITGVVSKFAPNAKIIHLDVDYAEQNKNVKVAHGIHSEVKYALDRLLQLSKNRKDKKPDFRQWIDEIECWKKQHPYPFSRVPRKHISSPEAIEALYEVSKGDILVTTGVGQHQMWTPQNFIFRRPRQFISSLGAGTMGFGLPAAIGVKVARPDQNVVDIDGDGSFQMNIQEMATAVMENIPVKVMMLNNQFLGMVMQWEDMIYEGVRGNTVLSRDPENPGGPENIAGLYPDYPAIAKGYDWETERVYKKEDLKPAIQRMLKSKKPYLLEVIVEYDEHVLPFIPPGKSANDMITDCARCPSLPECKIMGKRSK